MGETTKIQWTDKTFNPWWGCTKISPGCDNCYAEAFDHRLGGGHWGKGAQRRTFGEKHWREPLKWNEAAGKAGTRAKVFCASMADVFDAEAPDGQIERLWALIRETPHLDWQLLTKRPNRITRSLPPDWGEGYANVWLGTTVENQEQADLRIPVLLSVPARIRFLSMEPLLGPVDMFVFEMAALDWVIIGGESGHGARPFDLDWARSILSWGKQIGVPCFMKQLGADPRAGDLPLAVQDHKGGDWTEWPTWLRVRQFPEPLP